MCDVDWLSPDYLPNLVQPLRNPLIVRSKKLHGTNHLKLDESSKSNDTDMVAETRLNSHWEDTSKLSERWSGIHALNCTSQYQRYSLSG